MAYARQVLAQDRVDGVDLDLDGSEQGDGRKTMTPMTSAMTGMITEEERTAERQSASP